MMILCYVVETCSIMGLVMALYVASIDDVMLFREVWYCLSECVHSASPVRCVLSLLYLCTFQIHTVYHNTLRHLPRGLGIWPHKFCY